MSVLGLVFILSAFCPLLLPLCVSIYSVGGYYTINVVGFPVKSWKEFAIEVSEGTEVCKLEIKVQNAKQSEKPQKDISAQHTYRR